MASSRWEDLPLLPSRSAPYATKALNHSRSSRNPSARKDKLSKGGLQSDADKNPVIYISDDDGGVEEPITISDDDDAELTTYGVFPSCLSTTQHYTTFADIALLIPTESIKEEMDRFSPRTPPRISSSSSLHLHTTKPPLRSPSSLSPSSLNPSSLSVVPSLTDLNVMSPSQGKRSLEQTENMPPTLPGQGEKRHA